MNVVLLNLPWPHPTRPLMWGVRAGSRWPHFQERPGPGILPRYIPFPQFLGIAASVLAGRGHEVMLVDAVAEDTALDAVMERLRAFKTDVIFAETSSPSLSADMSALDHIRESIAATVICGGAHGLEMVNDLMEAGCVADFWVAGEYEFALAELVDRISAGEATDDVAGVIARGARGERMASIQDVDSLPSPLYDRLPMANYSDPVCGLPSPTAPAWLSRGCPFGCSFCVWPQVIYGNRTYRPRNIVRALNEVELLIRDYGCESFYFDDDTANIGEDRMLLLGAEIVKRGLDVYPWAMMARADCMTDRALDALAAAGLYSIKYGVESVSPTLREACGKGTDIAALMRAIDRTRSAGVKMHLTFTLGLPGETRATIDETVDFAIAVAPETAQFSICTPFPGTKFYDECLANGRLTTLDWAQFLGSGAAVIGTDELRAYDLTAAHKAALKRWNGFVECRLAERKSALIARLDELTRGRRLWHVIGDGEFAGQLRAIAPHAPGGGNVAADSVPVIVSEHDEEKLWRRLVRSDPAKARSALRLHSAR